MSIDSATAPPLAKFYVLTLPDHPTDEFIHRLNELWRDVAGDVPLLILGNGATLTADPHAEALALLREFVEATDGGSDTYEVRDLITKARELLGVPKPW